jgi:CHAT domain-containing protein
MGAARTATAAVRRRPTTAVLAAAAISGLLIAAGAIGTTGHPAPPNPLTQINTLIAQGNFSSALESTGRVLGRTGPDTPVWLTLALRKAQVLERMGRQEAALAWLNSLQLDDERRPASRPLIWLLRERAWIESSLGRYKLADDDLSRSLAMARALHDEELIANIDIRHASNLAHLGRPEEADRALDDAENYLRHHTNVYLYASLLQYRGVVRLASNRFEDAVPFFERFIERSKKNHRKADVVGLNADVVSGLINLAWCWYRLGQSEKAAALYNEALPLSTAEDRYLVLGHLGNIARDRHDYAQAATYYRQAADLARGRNQEYYSTWLSDLAGTLCDQGQWAEAQRVNQESFAVKKTIQAARGAPFETLNAARIAAGESNVQEAEEDYKRLLASTQSDPAPLVEGSGRLAQLYAQTGRPELAGHQFEAALAMVDSNRADLHDDENKLSYLAHLIDLHQQYVEFLAGRGQWAKALAVAEASRARLLRERLGLAESSSVNRSIADYQAAARAGKVTFLSYWIAPERSYLWEITGTRFDHFTLPGEAEIQTKVEQYQAGLEKDRQVNRAAGGELFQLLLGQVAAGPRGRYVIVPDGPLYGLNLETLPAGPEGRYWLEDATVMVTPSLSLMLARRDEAHRNRRLLLVGDADEWNDEFPKLPNGEEELEGIEKSFPANERLVLSGATASPAGYQRAHPERFGFIHFDAHATTRRDYPLDSAIVLSREGDRGELSARDVLAMHTQAAVVTLSACHSAGARNYAGEGLVGLAWAFLQSGAGSVIAGLWDVSDNSSPRLMEHLYALLAEGDAPADALRAAKLALLQGGKYVHPFYWGAFQLYAGARER